LNAQTEAEKKLEDLGSRVYQMVELGKYEEAITLSTEVLDFSQREFGPEHPNTAQCLNDLASLYRLKEDYSKAEPLYLRALAVREKILGPSHPDTGESLTDLARLYTLKGDYIRAEPLYQRALVLFEKSAGPDHQDTAIIIDDLAELYQLKGDYVHAEPLYNRAIGILEKTPGPDDPLTAGAVSRFALFYQTTGDYGRAEALFQRALTTYEKALGPDHPATAISVGNLGELYRLKGDYTRAEPLFQRALGISEKALGSDKPGTAASLNNIGSLYFYKGDYTRAEPLFERALSIYEKALGPDKAETATTLNNLAELYRIKGDYARAEPIYQRAISILEKALGSDHPSVAASINNLADLYVSIGNYAFAQPLYRRALTIREQVLGPDHPDTARSLGSLGILAWETAKFADAQNYFGRGFRIEEINLNRVLVTGSEPQKQAYLDTFRGTTDTLITMGLSTPASALLAFTAVVQRKGRVLEAVTNEMNTLRRRLSKEDQQALDQLNQTRALLAYISIAGLTRRSQADYQTELRELAEKEDRLQAAVSTRSAEFRIEEQVLAPQDLQSALSKDAALIEFARFRPYRWKDAQKHWDSPHYAAFVLLKEGQVVGFDLGEGKRIDDLCTQFTLSLSSAANSGQTQQIARELDALVMQPIRSLLRGRTEVLVSPDGALNLIPFAALIDENKHYLVERYQFTYLGTGRDLLRLQLPSASRQPATIVANPAFGTSRDPAGCRFEARSGFADEADAIAGRIPNAGRMIGDKASKAGLQALAGPRILHVATHGFFDMSGDCVPKGASPMLRSGLALAGANNRDGIMTALEIADLDLWGTQLVVLSACETGVGEARDGEGVFGMRRALVIAGSRAQVISLWEVDDESTRDLMVAYYDRLLAGAGRSAALRAVQLEMLKDGRDASAWAAFIPSGDWTPLGR
jgi:CHAT domain-containing protein/Tfp pilus assembly protein PilF